MYLYLSKYAISLTNIFNFFFQEFGEGARARRLYENDSDEEEDVEAVLLKENPKLQQGK